MAVAIVPAVEAKPPMYAPPRAGLGRLRKIALLGSHEASLKFAPWDDPSWELWGHASSRGMYRRAPERLFDLHRKECWTKTNRKGQKYQRWLSTQPTPIYMWEHYPEVPSSIRYPLERVKMTTTRPYFTNHAAYMIALALIEGVTHLGFFGVNYSPDGEYGTQRGSLEYWMGRAESTGVQLVMPDACTLLADPKELYGYESHDEQGTLVEAYTKRVWTRGKDGAAKTMALDARGLEIPPAGIAEKAATELIENPPPDGCMRPYMPQPAPHDVPDLVGAPI